MSIPPKLAVATIPLELMSKQSLSTIPIAFCRAGLHTRRRTAAQRRAERTRFSLARTSYASRFCNHSRARHRNPSQAPAPGDGPVAVRPCGASGPVPCLEVLCRFGCGVRLFHFGCERRHLITPRDPAPRTIAGPPPLHRRGHAPCCRPRAPWALRCAVRLTPTVRRPVGRTAAGRPSR